MSDLQQRSPESVLFEPEHVDSCCNELSPDIVDRFSRIKLENSIEIMDEIATEETTQLNLSTPKRNIRLDRSLKYSKCNVKYLNNYSKDNIKSVFDESSNLTDNYPYRKKMLSLTNSELNSDQITSVMYNELSLKHNSSNPKPILSSSEYELSYGNTSPFQVIASHSYSKSSKPVFTDDVPEVFNNESASVKSVVITGKTLEKASVLRKDRDIVKRVDDCYLLNKTLSMNDDLINEMNIYLDRQSMVKSDNNIDKVTSSITNCKLQNKYITESGNLVNLMNKTDTQSALVNETRSSFDEYETTESICGLIDEHDKSQNNANKGTKLKDISNLTTVEKIAEQLIANWNEFRKMFAYLLQINKKLCKTNISNSVPMLTKYKKLIEDHTSLSVSSSPTICTSRYLSPKNSKRSGSHNVIGSSLMNEDRNIEQSHRREKTKFRSREHPTTPCRRSLSSAKRRRVILQFEENEKSEDQQQLKTYLKNTDPLAIEKKSEEDSFSLNLSSHEKMHWNNCTSELTSLFVTDLHEVSDYDQPNVNLQEVKFYLYNYTLSLEDYTRLNKQKETNSLSNSLRNKYSIFNRFQKKCILSLYLMLNAQLKLKKNHF